MSQTQSQNKTLSTFFGTELWERYGFYIVQSLLTLYLAEHYGWQDGRIYRLTGSFTAITYLSPIIGGFIADKFIGQKASIILGIIILFFSYCALTKVYSVTSLEAVLAGIAVGTGLLKPNISSLLGNTYPIDSPKRESGFTIFYMGITTGIILGTTLPSILHRYFGWSAAFFSAALGLIFAGIIFIRGIYKYEIHDYSPHILVPKSLFFTFLTLAGLWIGGFCILIYPKIGNIAFSLVALACVGYIIYSAMTEPALQAKKTLAVGLLCFISAIFWAFYFQMFTSLTLFIARMVEPTLFGITFPAPYYVGIQSAGMLVFGYLLAKKYLHGETNAVSIAKKFLLAIFLMMSAYGVIALVSNVANPETFISPLWVIPAYVIISLAELLLSPTGLSAITLLSDPKKVSTMMGVFFVSLGIGAFLSGKLALIAALPKGQILTVAEMHAKYGTAFIKLFGILVIALGFCAVLMWFIRYLFKEEVK